MIPAKDYVASHSRADVALLHQLWAQGLSAGEIGRRLGVCQSTVSKWAQRYKLPPRPPQGTDEYPAPSAEDEVASLSGLALSPWVAERAKVERDKHMAERRAEPEIVAAAKARAWRRGDQQPKGAHHDRL